VRQTDLRAQFEWLETSTDDRSATRYQSLLARVTVESLDFQRRWGHVMRNNANKLSLRRLRPSPAMIIALFALLVAMSTGAYAAVTMAPPNSVNSKAIKNEAVKTEDLAAQAVTKGKLKKASVNGQKIIDDSVGTKDIGDGQVDLPDISTAAKTAFSHGGPTYSTHFEAGKPVPTTLTTMASLSLPAGAYVLISKAQIDTNLGADIVHCDLVDGLGNKDTSFVQSGNFAATQIITNNLVTTYTNGGTPSLQCQTSTGGTISQARLTAINVSSATSSP
jgi:hypothetical protein